MYTRSLPALLRGKVNTVQGPLDFDNLLNRLPHCTAPSEAIDYLRRYSLHCESTKTLSTLNSNDRVRLFQKIPREARQDAVYAYCLSSKIIKGLEEVPCSYVIIYGSKTLCEALLKTTSLLKILEYWRKLLQLNEQMIGDVEKMIPEELERSVLYVLERCVAEKQYRSAVRTLDDLRNHVNRMTNGRSSMFDWLTCKTLIERHVVAILLGSMESGVPYHEIRRLTDDFYFPLHDALTSNGNCDEAECTALVVLIYLAGYGNNMQQIEGMWETGRLETLIDRSTLCLAVCRACEMLRFDRMGTADMTKLLRLVEEVYNYQIQNVNFDEHHERSITAVVEFLDALVHFCFRRNIAPRGSIGDLLSMSDCRSHSIDPIIVNRCFSFAAQIFLRHEFTAIFQRQYYSTMLRILTTDPKRSLNWMKIVLFEMSRQGYRYISLEDRSALTTAVLLNFVWKVESLLRTGKPEIRCFWDVFRNGASKADQWVDFTSDHFDAFLFDGSLVSGLSGGLIREKTRNSDETYRPKDGIAKHDVRLYELLVRFWIRAAILLAILTCTTASSSSSVRVTSQNILRLLRNEVRDRYPYLSSSLMQQVKTESPPITVKSFSERRSEIVQGSTVRLTSSLLSSEARAASNLKNSVLMPITEELVWVYSWVLSRHSSTKLKASPHDLVSDDQRTANTLRYYSAACALEALWNSETLSMYAHDSLKKSSGKSLV